MRTYRHGDLVIQQIAALPADAALQLVADGLVRAGSSSADANHVLLHGTVNRAADGTIYLSGSGEMTLRHGSDAGGRHRDGLLPAGCYIVRPLVVSGDAGAEDVVD